MLAIVHQINQSRFKAFVMFSREPLATFLSQEFEYYSNTDTTILGTIVLDYHDKDYSCIILSRDEVDKFRAFDLKVSIEKLEDARIWIKQKIAWHTERGIRSVPQGGKVTGVDLFKIVVPDSKMHPYFKRLNEDDNFIPAKKIIFEVSKYFNDIDGNFVEQFQSINGFDSRLWEIYLFCMLTEENFSVKRDNDRPDFIVDKFGVEIAIEAVIVDRKPENPPKYYSDIKDSIPGKIDKENANDMPLRFGSPLFSKLQKKYWDLPHVKGKPIIIAIADFHDDMSMTWSFNAIIDYLYGLKFSFIYSPQEELIISSQKIPPYKKPSGAEVEAGYFSEPETENISAVLFSSTGTLSKFTRLGLQAGFTVEGLRVFRAGLKYRHDPNASKPDFFLYEVDESSTETWAEGVNLFHNPNALIPIDKTLFPSVAHHELVDDRILSVTPEFHPYFSYNHNIISK